MGWVAQLTLLSLPFNLAWLAADDLPFVSKDKFNGQVVGRDFINFWTSSRLLLQHHVDDIFVPARYSQALYQIWGAGLYRWTSYDYPPTLLTLTGWLAALPYPIALLVWTVLGVAALVAALWPYSKRPLVLAGVVLAPATITCVETGQNGLLTGALMVGAFRLLDRRPYLAGVLIGLLTAKPQLGLLIPVALVAAGRWRVIASASVTALILFGLSLALVGAHGWALYLTQTAPFEAYLYSGTKGMWQIMSLGVPVAAKAAGLPWLVAVMLQAPVSVGAALVAWFRFRRMRKEGRSVEALDILVLATAALIAAPYSLTYDMPGVAAALLLVGAKRPELDRLVRWRWAAFLLWTAPILIVVVGLATYVNHLWQPPLGVAMLIAGGLLVSGLRQPASADSDA